MATSIMFSCLLYFLLFIVQNLNTSAVSFRGGLKKGEISQNECGNCDQYDRMINKEIDDIFIAKEKKLKNTKVVSETLYKYIKPKNQNKYSYLLLKGWGARGMPFNVLYTPNIQQQKMMKFVPERQLVKEPVKILPEIYNLVLKEEKSSLKAIENTLKKHTMPRKYYSLIPQFFVSYGW